MMIENQGATSGEDQYVNTKYVQERLMVSRTKAYEIVREIEDTYAPGAVIRVGLCLRARKDVFSRWVEEQGTSGKVSYGNEPVRQQENGDLRLAG